MKLFVFILITIMTICYPFLIYWGLSTFQNISFLAIGGIILTILQFSLRSMEAKKNILQFLPLALALIITYTIAFFLNKSIYMQLTPVIINFNFLVLFAISLFKPPSMVERFARLRFKELPPEATPYCRKVTLIWILFFIGNGSIAYWTIFQDIKVWTFYNGFLAYILMGILFASEYLYRTFFIKKKTDFAISPSSLDFTKRSVVKFRCRAMLKELNCTKNETISKGIELSKKRC